jgi:hypothetical protein
MADPATARTQLAELVAAFETHLDAASRRTGEADPVVFAAYARLAAAFAEYEETVYELYDEVVPMSLIEYDDDDDEDEDEDEDLEALDDGDDLDDDADSGPEVDV